MTPLTPEERRAYVDAIHHLDPTGQVLTISDDLSTFRYSKSITLHETIPTPPNDEELVRGLLVVGLHRLYRYPLEAIELERRVKLAGSSGHSQYSPESDILVHDPSSGAPPFLFFEIKSPTAWEPEKRKAVKNQLFTPATQLTPFQGTRYIAYATLMPPDDPSDFPLRVVGIHLPTFVADGHAPAYDSWIAAGSPAAFSDIPADYGSPKIDLFAKGSDHDIRKDLSLREIRQRWSKIWNLIWGGTVEDNSKFAEFNKLLLAKIIDERDKEAGDTYEFQVKYFGGTRQTPRQVFRDINRLYRRAFQKYLAVGTPEDDVVALNDNVLSPETVTEIVDELDDISLSQNVYKNIDILAHFYETVIRDAFKQTKGLYLTPPNIVLFIIAGLQLEELTENRLREGSQTDWRMRLPFICDPSCGTGTFLLWAMNYVTEYINNNRPRLESFSEETRLFLDQFAPTASPNVWARDYIYGMDKDAILATASQINMILHGDGSTNVFNVDGLRRLGHYKNALTHKGVNNVLTRDSVTRDTAYTRPCLETFDVIVSNPPFSAPIEHRSELTSTFELRGDSESYFFERWYQLLRPGGRVGAVLPEAFFAVDDYKEERNFLFRHFNIKAVVALPTTAFAPHTSTLTSLLFAQKKTRSEEIEVAETWEASLTEFDTRKQRALAPMSKLSKTKLGNESPVDVFKEIEDSVAHQFGNKVTFPVFTEAELRDPSRWTAVKASIRKAVDSISNWFIVEHVASTHDFTFISAMASEIGYKQQKKGVKARPNQLLSAYRADKGHEGTKILNIQETRTPLRIDFDDTDTILGLIRRHVSWD